MYYTNVPIVNSQPAHMGRLSLFHLGRQQRRLAYSHSRKAKPDLLQHEAQAIIEGVWREDDVFYAHTRADAHALRRRLSRTS